MEHRLGRSIRVFLILLSAAGFYRLTVVPLVEPRVGDTFAPLEPTPEEAAAIRARAEGRMTAVGEIFPPGSWERDEPIVLESRQMRLLFKQYHNLPDGRVNLVPCTMVILPDPKKHANDADGGRTVVLRAPQGALLEFAEPFDLRHGKLSRLMGGSLRGQITIRGTPTAEGAEDDIEIITRDVELVGDEVRSSEPVQFRYGRSTGSGRALLVKLLQKPGGSDQGPNIGGIDSIKLEREVNLKLEGLGGGITPGGDVARKEPSAPEPPVAVSCRGSLTVLMAANLITLEDHVDVVRSLPDGGSDQLACELLSIALAKKEGSGLAATEIEARGRPVVARSTAAGLEARAGRLGYEIATRRILLDGDQPVSLLARDVEMESRSIDYVPGPPGDPGSLMAVGPGWLKSKGAGGQPPTVVRYRKWLRMKPDAEGHVASISGDADVSVEAQGRLAASEIHLWLEVAKGGPAAAPASRNRAAGSTGPDLSGVRPTRMLARGMVEIDAEQLAARTDRMEVWFRHPPPPAAAAPAAPKAAASPAVTAAPPPPPAAAPPDEPKPPRSRLRASGGLLRGLVVMTPRGQQLEELSLEGQVHLVEEPLEKVDAAASSLESGKPLELRGDQMQLSRPTQFDARAIVAGRPATISGRDADLEGPIVEFDRGRNRMTVDGAGRLRLPVQEGNAGFESFAVTSSNRGPTPPGVRGPAAGAERLDVTWQGRMDFDGLTTRFIDKVVAKNGAASLHAGSLDVVFDRPFAFGGTRPEAGAARPQVARIACGSGVRLESATTSDDGSRSVEKLSLRDMVIDRATGDVTGSGPGRLSTVRFGQPPGMMAAPTLPGGPPAVQAPQPSTPRADELTYLGVDFQRGMRGNINRRAMEFHQRVEAIWGPVKSWESSLDPHAPAGLPERAVSVNSDVLAVGQTPVAIQQRNPIELLATGNVLVEGDSFTARAGRLSWSEAKDLLVFEGDGRSDAQLFRQMQVGAPTSTASAGRILYWRGLNRVDVDDARYIDLDQLGGGNGGGLKLPGMSGQPRRKQ